MSESSGRPGLDRVREQLRRLEERPEPPEDEAPRPETDGDERDEEDDEA